MQFKEVDGKVQIVAKEFVFPGDTVARNEWLTSHHQEKDIKSSCVTCHRSNNRWNWDTYSLRPGLLENKPGAEKKFEEGKNQHVRYKFVGGKKTLADSLGKLQVQWMTDQIPQKFPDWDRWKFAVIAAAGRCPGIEGFIPFSASEYGYDSLQVLEKKNLEAALRYDDARVERATKNKDTDGGTTVITNSHGLQSDGHHHISGPRQQIKGTTSLRYILQWGDVDLDQFSTTKERGTFGFRIAGVHIIPTDGTSKGPNGSPTLYEDSLFIHLAEKTRLVEKGALKNGTGWNANCEWLKTESLKALKDFHPAKNARRKNPALEETHTEK
jgi:hypothetical protein